MNPEKSAIPDADEIRRITQEVLSRSEFRDKTGNAVQKESWLSRFLENLELPDFLISDTGVTVFRIIVIAVVCVLGFIVVRRMIKNIKPGRFMEKPSMASAGSGIRRHSHVPEIPGRLLDKAERSLSAGDLRSAIRHLYRALILFLTLDGLLKLEHWKTNGIYLRECPRGSKPYPLLAEITRSYDEIVYAGTPCDPEVLDRYLSALRKYGTAQ